MRVQSRSLYVIGLASQQLKYSRKAWLVETRILTGRMMKTFHLLPRCAPNAYIRRPRGGHAVRDSQDRDKGSHNRLTAALATRDTGRCLRQPMRRLWTIEVLELRSKCIFV